MTILAWLAVLGVLGSLMQHFTKTILMVILAAVVAFAVTPVIGLLSRRLPRGVAIGIAFLLAFAVIMGLVGVLVVTLATQIAALVKNLPEYAQRANQLQPQVVSLVSPLGVTNAQVDQARAQLVASTQTLGTQLARDVLGFAQTFLGAVIDAILVLMLSIYLAANGPRVRRWLQAQAPAGQQRRVRILAAIVNQVVGGYIRSTLILALLIGVLVGAGMGVLQVRYALLLGVLAFFMEFIPILGVFVSGAVCVVVGLFTGPITAVLVLAYFVVVHVIEGDIIGPRIMGKAVGIHPAVALIALLAGTEVFGIWGALFGAPAAGLLQAVVTAAWREYRAGAGEVAKDAAGKQGEENTSAQRQTA